MKSIKEIIGNLRVAMTDARQNESHFESWMILNEAICNAIDALADSALDRMADNARELGLDYEPIVEQVEDSVGMGHGAWDMVEPKELAKAFHEALADQPASKPWVGLTDAEIQKEFHPLHATGLQFARSIEAKLKEKNT